MNKSMRGTLKKKKKMKEKKQGTWHPFGQFKKLSKRYSQLVVKKEDKSII